jgi:hypothetical protein
MRQHKAVRRGLLLAAFSCLWGSLALRSTLPCLLRISYDSDPDMGIRSRGGAASKMVDRTLLEHEKIQETRDLGLDNRHRTLPPSLPPKPTSQARSYEGYGEGQNALVVSW